MQGKIITDTRFCLAENGCSLDEIVRKVLEMFEGKELAALIRLILGMTQDILVFRLTSGSNMAKPCCEGVKMQLNSGYPRSILTSVGEVRLDLVRVRCPSCGKTFVPLLRHLGIERHQSVSGEFEKIIVEAAAGDTYRRAVANLAMAGRPVVPHRTAYDIVMRSDCDEIQISERTVGSSPIQLMPDGTKFKGPGQDGKAVQGDLKVAIGVDTSGQVFPLGAWSDKSWEAISAEWKKNEVKLPDGSILICDGEAGISDAFCEYVDDLQRCQWHINRDLYHAMWRDGGKAKDARPLQRGLAEVMAIELPAEDFATVSETDKDAIEKQMEDAERMVGKLILHLESNGYEAAAGYLSKRYIIT